MDQMIAADPAAGEGRTQRVAFTGQNGDFRRLVTLGALLEVVTFGFYRFWLQTNMRRHLWTHTLVGDDALEYTGRGRELLIGFLFALAILAPLYILFFYISIEAERQKAFLSVPLFLFFYGFFQFAVYRARRYRLTRTIWRGVRFWMTGSGVAYAFRAFGWEILTVLTLGLAYPWAIASLERYKMGHTYYGNLPGAFDGRGWDFFKRGWWLWVLALVPIGLYATAVVTAIGLESAAKAAGRPTGQAGAEAGGLILLASLSLIVLPFIFAAFKAIEWKWWASSISFGGVRFQSDLRRGALIGTYWKLIGMGFVAMLIGLIFLAIVLAIGFGVMWAVGIDFNALGAQMKAGHFSAAMIPVVILYLFSYLGIIQAVGIVRRISAIQRVWKIVVSSITIHHLEAADHVLAAGEAAGALGEGLADGLDLAGF